MSFNQAMSIPLELGLQTTPDGLRLSRTPVKELEALRSKSHTFGPIDGTPGVQPIPGITGELLDVTVRMSPGEASRLALTIRGVPMTYDTKSSELRIADHKVTVPLQDGKLTLRVITDRTVVEVFADGGRIYAPVPVLAKTDSPALTFEVLVGKARLEQMTVHELRSIWSK